MVDVREDVDFEDDDQDNIAHSKDKTAQPSDSSQNPTPAQLSGNSQPGHTRTRKRQKPPKDRRRPRPELDVERAIMNEIQPLLDIHISWIPPRIHTSAAMELGNRISKAVVPAYAELTGIDERKLSPQWVGIIGDGLPTADSWTIFVDDVRRHTIDYLQYPSCMGTRFVEASKLSNLLQESFVDPRTVEETILRLLASPPPEGACMTETYAQVMLVLSQERPRSNDKDWSDLVNEFYDLYSIVTVVGSLTSTETEMATRAKNQFRTMSRSIMANPSLLRVHTGQLRVHTSRFVKVMQDFVAQSTLV